ncbi:MAG: hypothetical protein ACK5U8_06520, partial [Deltaproteobacteria bacterium]
MRSASWCFRLSMVLVAWSMVLGVERASAQTAAAARAPGPSPELLATRRRLLREPTPRQTVEAALRYFRVHPEAVDGLRAAARARGSVPLIAGGYRSDQAETGRSF